MSKDSILYEQRKDIKDEFLKPLQKCNQLEKRKYKEDNRDRPDGEFQRDYTRILYSSSFRRLQGKMQLFAVQSDQFIRNRLTHSLEVAQIARSIATEIGYKKRDIFVVEACALAHDIGNPPFGHAGERFLNDLCKEFGGFEGNAQTFRILTTVEQKRAHFQGLNLTYRTLLGVLKYYNKHSYTVNKFIYDNDYEFVSKIVKETDIKLRTLDVQIVDLADEIAYAAHDLEDGLRLGIFTTDEILHDFCKIVDDEKCQEKLEKIFTSSKKRAGFRNSKIDAAEFSKLYHKEIASKIIYSLINDIGIVELSKDEKNKRGGAYDREIGFSNYKSLASGLKKTTFNCITNNDEVYAYETNGKKMMKWLYEFYQRNPEYLPPEYRKKNIVEQYKAEYKELRDDKNLQNRLIIDYIAGMMDEYVKTSYNRLNQI